MFSILVTLVIKAENILELLLKKWLLFLKSKCLEPQIICHIYFQFLTISFTCNPFNWTQLSVNFICQVRNCQYVNDLPLQNHQPSAFASFITTKNRNKLAYYIIVKHLDFRFIFLFLSLQLPAYRQCCCCCCCCCCYCCC